MYLRGLLVVIGSVGTVAGLSFRTFDDPVYSDVCIRFVISSMSINDAFVDWNWSVSIAMDTATVVCFSISLLNFPFSVTDSVRWIGILFVLSSLLMTSPLSFALSFCVDDGDDDDNEKLFVCCVSPTSGIVCDTINSFTVPLLWLLFDKLVLFSIVVKLLLLAMTPKDWNWKDDKIILLKEDISKKIMVEIYKKFSNFNLMIFQNQLFIKNENF